METTPVITPRDSSDEKQEASTPPPPPATTEKRTRGRPRRVLTEEEIAERKRKKQTLYKDYNKEYHLKYYHAKLRKEMECILSSGGGLRSEHEAPIIKKPEMLESPRKAQSFKHGS